MNLQPLASHGSPPCVVACSWLFVLSKRAPNVSALPYDPPLRHISKRTFRRFGVPNRGANFGKAGRTPTLAGSSHDIQGASVALATAGRLRSPATPHLIDIAAVCGAYTSSENSREGRDAKK